MAKWYSKKRNLNSTVILLIFYFNAVSSERVRHLNSTVILLISESISLLHSFRIPFKFHCDSINIACVHSPNFIVFWFKFHCDSINIIQRYTSQTWKSWDLNSTVILLILTRMSFTFVFKRRFKFHCDSINILKKSHYIQEFQHLNSTVILLISEFYWFLRMLIRI